MPTLTQPGGKITLNFVEFELNKDCVILAHQFGKECSKKVLLLSSFLCAWALGRRGRGCWRVTTGIYFSREQELEPKPQFSCQHAALVLQLLPNTHLGDQHHQFCPDCSFEQPP